MIQSFQCPICGTLNALGEPECSECGQGFVYNCPVCGSPLNNRYATCPNCRTVFNWGPSARPAAMEASPAALQETYQQQQQAAPVTPPVRRQGGDRAGYTARPLFWVTLIIVCAIIIALLLIADRIINN